jgi:hypothetical protein
VNHLRTLIARAAFRLRGSALAGVIIRQAFSAVQREQVSAEVELIAREALELLGLGQSGFVVFVNGGGRQDARQLHFHLVTGGYELAVAPDRLAAGVWIDVPDPAHDVHQVRAGGGPLLAGLTRAAAFGDALQLGSRGYSIIWDQRDRVADGVVHLTAGMPEHLP